MRKRCLLSVSYTHLDVYKRQEQVSPLSGEFLFGHQIEVGYFDQELAQFDTNNTVLEEVWNDFSELNRTEVRTALGCFLFSGEDVFKTVDCLSGGEKVRLSFVKLMLSQPNFLMMDEPTNHLDLICLLYTSRCV